MSESATTTRPLDTDDIVVKCSKLTKVFNDFWMRPRVKAVDEIDLEIHRGEVFGLLGPNGSGKSTTIKMLLGLLHRTRGHIAVFGKHPRDVSIKTRIGYLPEESYLYPFLNARETLDYYGRLFHQPASQRHKRIDMLLEMVGLDRVARRPVGEYSKGMARRIGLAQALINDPQLLVLDEPTTGMDPLGTADVKRLIQTLARRGKTILLCSHLLADVEDVCDRVAVMYGGSIQAHGTVDELLEDQHTTTIQTQELDEQTLEHIEQTLSQHGRHIERVDRPRQRLEQLFLEIVAQAKQKGRETSGAQSGGGIASFLEHGDQNEDDLIESLTAASPSKVSEAQAQPAAVTPAAPSSIPAQPAHPPKPAETHNDSVLDALSAPPDESKDAPQASSKGSDQGDESKSKDKQEPAPDRDEDLINRLMQGNDGS